MSGIGGRAVSGIDRVADADRYEVICGDFDGPPFTAWLVSATRPR